MPPEAEANDVPETEMTADQLRDKYGGSIWDEHPDYPASDWQHEVSEDNTRLGYWDWVGHEIEQQAELDEED